MKEPKSSAPPHDASAASKRERWARYQERHRQSPLGSGVDRVGAAADFWLNAWKEHASAGVGWAQEIVENREYPLRRVVPDVITFSSALADTATSWLRFVTGADKPKP
jgi:hypothetical protein